jgi:hypothetical protein
VPQRRVSSDTVDNLREKVVLEYGSLSSIVGPIRQILSSQMFGIGKTTTFECDVEIEETKKPFRLNLLGRERTIDLIYDEEEEKEETGEMILEEPSAPVPASKSFFQETLAQLEEEISLSDTPRISGPKIAKKRRDRVPVVATMPGNIVIVAGVGTDSMQIANQFSAYYGSSKICTGGEIATGIGSLVDRRSALAARTLATDEGRFVIVAFGIIPGRDYTEELQMLDATQVWAAVDASRKTDDTRVWVALLDEATDVDALAVVGTTATQTPASVNELDIPIGWIEDEPALEPKMSSATAGIIID